MGLLEAHKGILYKVANAYCQNREDRSDLLQETVIQLWRSFDSFDDRFKFSTWMYRIAMNVAISFYRSESRHSRSAVPLEEFGLEVADADQVLAEASDDLRRLYELIHQMDALNRALILLYLDGYGHEAIAETVGISSSNVATRINRIKQRLQRDFNTA